MAASKAYLGSHLDRAVPDLWYCCSSETLGLGQCRCNSHDVFGRRDGAETTEADCQRFRRAVSEADALADALAAEHARAVAESDAQRAADGAMFDR